MLLALASDQEVTVNMNFTGGWYPDFRLAARVETLNHERSEECLSALDRRYAELSGRFLTRWRPWPASPRSSS